jgi:hypothetical protein
MKIKNPSVVVFGFLILFTLSNCSEKEEPATDFAQLMLGEWTISETFTLAG